MNIELRSFFTSLFKIQPSMSDIFLFELSGKKDYFVSIHPHDGLDPKKIIKKPEKATQAGRYTVIKLRTKFLIGFYGLDLISLV